MKKILLYFGGILNLLIAMGHMAFWNILQWDTELIKLSSENQGVMQVLNICVIFTILYFSAISFVLAKKETFDFSSKSIFLLIAGFYGTRLIFGYPFFGFNAEEVIIWVLCLVLIGIYLSLLLVKKLQ